MKIRKKINWEEWKTSNSRHNRQILLINAAIILGVFVFAAIIQYS